jgi:hypothetical protein
VLARTERQRRRAPSLRLLRDAPRDPGGEEAFDTRPEEPTTMPR